MKKTFKTVTALALAAALVLAMAGCGGDKPTGGSVGGGNKDNGPAIALIMESETEVSAADETNGMYIQALVDNPDNPVLAGFAADIAGNLTQWQQALGEGETMLVQALSLDTENYLSVVITKFVAPNYGSDGQVYTYVYDKIIDSAMNEDLAVSLGGMTDDMIAEALVNYLDAGQEWISFNIAGYAMAEDGKPVYFVETEVEQEGADNWTYLYVLKDGQIRGTLSQLIEELTPAQ